MNARLLNRFGKAGYPGLVLGLDHRALKVSWTVLLFVLTVSALYFARKTLIIFALALFVAHLLSPVVAIVDRVAPPRFPRTATLAIVYIVFIAVLAGILIPLGSTVADQAATFAKQIPQTVNQETLNRIPLPGWLEPLRERIVAAIHERLDEIGRGAGPLVARSIESLASGITTAITWILIPILAFFFLRDGPRMRDAIVRLFPDRRRELADKILLDVSTLLVQYVRALVILSAITFVVYWILLSILGAPYGMLLAGSAGLLEFIPAIGPFVAVVLIIIVCVMNGVGNWLLLALFFAVYRVFQDYMVNPALMSSGAQIHPLLVLFGVLAGAEIGGIYGIFFSVPVIAALRIVLMRIAQPAFAPIEPEESKTPIAPAP